MRITRNYLSMLSVLAVGALIHGCGGGGGSSSGSLSAKTLQWEAPSVYMDGSPLNASTDLDIFEIYISENGLFSPDDQPEAAVSAADPDTGQITTSFDLDRVAPFFSKGVIYHVSVRAVAKTGLKSEFSTSATFSY